VQFESADRAVDENLAMTRALRREIGNGAGRAVAENSAETRAAWSALEQERLRLDLELVGKRARQAALVRAMKEVSNDLAAKATKDPVAEELEKVVKVREHAVETVQQVFKSGAGASQQDVLEAEGKLAESRARMLERRDLVADRTGGTIMVDLNKELQSVIITVAEGDAKLTAVSKSLRGFESVADKLERLQEVEADREPKAEELVKARRLMADLLQEMPEPQLTILPAAAPESAATQKTKKPE
jgi:hypothetical protein